MKYVVYQIGDFEVPVVFPDFIAHSQLKVEVGAPDSGKFAKPVSAGSCLIVGDNVVMGETGSMSLKLRTRGEKDRKLLHDHINLNMPVQQQ